MLSNNLEYYLKNQQELVKKYNGKYIIIFNQEVVSSHDTIEEAQTAGQKNHVLGTFTIQKCVENDKDIIIDSHC